MITRGPCSQYRCKYHIYAHTIRRMASFPEAPGFRFSGDCSAEQENDYFDWNLLFHAWQRIIPLSSVRSPGPQWSVCQYCTAVAVPTDCRTYCMVYWSTVVVVISVIITIEWSTSVCLCLAIIIKSSSLGNIRVPTGFLLQLISVTINAKELICLLGNRLLFRRLRSFLLNFPFGGL